MYVLDTDILNLVFNGDARVLARRTSVPSKEIAIAVITRIELLQGRFDFLLKAATAADLLRARQLLERTELLLSSVSQILPIDDRAASQFERLRETRGLKKIGRGDLLIAAVALAHRATLVTRNLKHFRLVPGLQVETWAD